MTGLSNRIDGASDDSGKGRGKSQKPKADDLLEYIFADATTQVASTCARWIQLSPRFKAFVEAQRDKLRKKARGLRDAEGFADLQAELSVAYWLLGERSFTLEYEKYLAEKMRGPDYTVTWKGHIVLNVEVKRLRATTSDARTKYSAALCDKLRQAPPHVMNLVTLVSDSVIPDEAEFTKALAFLRARAEHKDDAFFMQRGFTDAREYFRYYRRLSGVSLRSESIVERPGASVLWINNEATHAIPKDLRNLLAR
ncbi:MAG: hypothetical protein ABI068_01275 [Ktedonobacterales bacterium]